MGPSTLSKDARVQNAQSWLREDDIRCLAGDIHRGRRPRWQGPVYRLAPLSERTGLELDLIMMPTHGGRHFRSLLIGSVTAKVLHDVRCPVWTWSRGFAKPVRVEHWPARSRIRRR